MADGAGGGAAARGAGAGAELLLNSPPRDEEELVRPLEDEELRRPMEKITCTTQGAHHNLLRLVTFSLPVRSFFKVAILLFNVGDWMCLSA